MAPNKVRAWAGCALLVPLLASCFTSVNPVPYPAAWRPVRPTATQSCPKIEGTYRDQGEVAGGGPRSCTYPECGSLAFNLLSDPYVFSKGNAPSGGVVRINQPSAGRVEVSGGPRRVREELSLAAGDFVCDASGLRLRTKSTGLFLVLENSINEESRIFNVADDGSLVMKAEWHNRANQLVAGYSNSGEVWVRWERLPQPGE